MPAGDPIFTSNLIAGQFWLQESTGFEETETGFDTGTRIFETVPGTLRSQYPARTSADKQFASMFVTNIRDRILPSTMKELIVTYKGIVQPNGTAGPQKTVKVTPGCDLQFFTLPALQSLSSPIKVNISAPLPVPSCHYEYVTLTQPTLAGCGSPAGAPASGGSFPGLPSFSISFVPDPSITQNANYYSGWVLESRTWDQTGIPCWLVREFYKYYFAIVP